MPMFSQGTVTPVRENERKTDREQVMTYSTKELYMMSFLLLTTIVDSPGTAPRWRRMDPELLGRTLRFHPCLQRQREKETL